MHLIGHHAARRFLNFPLGWQLMRDPRVQVSKKAAAVTAGLLITLALLVCEVPLEGVLGLIAPVVGFGADLMIDGAEIALFPLLISLAILPYLVKSNETMLIRVRSTDHIAQE